MRYSKDGIFRFSTKITFASMLIISVIAVYIMEKQNYTDKRLQCQIYAQSAAIQFQRDVQNHLLVNEILEAMITETDGKIIHFHNLAKSLVNKFPALDFIQIAPDGIISESYPSKSFFENGMSLLTAPETKTASSYAIKTQKPYLTGPVQTKDNNQILIVQQPIFFTDETGESNFWGFTLIHLNINSLFQKDTLEFLDENGYFFCLWKPDPKTSEITNLAQNTEKEIINPCEEVIRIANSLWTIYVSPKNGWINKNRIITGILIGLAFSIFISLGIALLISLKDRDSALENLSFRDSLTSLYNARKFISVLKELQSKNQNYFLIYMDLNDFKQINDNFGHEVGDEVLIITGRKISNCIKETDRAFRIGGDEFAIIIEGSHDISFIKSVIQRIKDSISRETVLKSGRFQFTASAGYARFPEDAKEYEEIIKIADKAMYKDKKEFKENKKNNEVQ